LSGIVRSGGARLAVALAVLPGIVGLPAAGRAAEGAEHRTNVELAEEAIRGAVGEALATYPKDGGGLVRLAPLSTSDVNPLVESVLVEEMAARGLPVVVATGADSLASAAGVVDSTDVAPDSADPGAWDDARLFYRVTDFSFRYADIYRKMMFGPRRIRRLAKVDLHLRLAAAGGPRIVWSENVAHSAADVVPFGKADLLESKTYAFAKPERGQSTLSKLYEPLIVGSIVGGLVFLFYSNQSGD
jgi:hypothetical protein